MEGSTVDPDSSRPMAADVPLPRDGHARSSSFGQTASPPAPSRSLDGPSIVDGSPRRRGRAVNLRAGLVMVDVAALLFSWGLAAIFWPATEFSCGRGQRITWVCRGPHPDRIVAALPRSRVIGPCDGVDQDLSGSDGGCRGDRRHRIGLGGMAGDWPDGTALVPRVRVRHLGPLCV